MFPNSSKASYSTSYMTPPSKKMLSPKAISRKPSFVSFTKKKAPFNNEETSNKQIDRVKFISPAKTNFLINDQTSIVRDSFNMSSIRDDQSRINYPFIKRCVSPKPYHQSQFSRKQSINLDSSLKDQSSILGTVLFPSMQDFSNDNIFLEQYDVKKLQQQVSCLKKQNFQLNILVDDKNQQIETLKKGFSQQLLKLNTAIQNLQQEISIKSLTINQVNSKYQQSENRCKQFCEKLNANIIKFDKANKQLKMYKAKFKSNYPIKEDQNAKNRKYHKNCCSRGIDHQKKGMMKNNQNSVCSGNKDPFNLLVESKKINQPCTSFGQLKKIKSQTKLPNVVSFEDTLEATKLMQIHSNEEQLSEYLDFKQQVQSLNNEIRYKNIQISILKKTKCEFEQQKQSYAKVKKFNKKLLARVEYLTKNFDEQDNNQKPNETPRKMINYQPSNFEEVLQFELSPQKQINDNIDSVFEVSF